MVVTSRPASRPDRCALGRRRPCSTPEQRARLYGRSSRSYGEESAANEALLHLHFAALARPTEAAITAGELAAVRRDFTFVDRVLARADEFVDNAIYASYLEHLVLSGKKEPAACLHEPARGSRLATLEAAARTQVHLAGC